MSIALRSIIPAKTGIQNERLAWAPACAGAQA